MRHHLAIVSVLVLLCSSLPAEAQSVKAAAKVSISLDVSVSAKAKAEAADQLYLAGDFEGALRLYEEGYLEFGEAAFLYAQAQCQIALGHLAEARLLFEQYLALGAKVALTFKAEAEASLGELKKILGAGIDAGVAVGGFLLGGLKAGAKIAGAVTAAATLKIAAGFTGAIKASVKLADDLYAKADFNAALKAYAEIYAKVPDPSLLYAMAQCHIALDHKLEAIALLRGYLSANVKLKFKAEAEALLAKLGVIGTPVISLAIAPKVSAAIQASVKLADDLYLAGDFLGALKAYADVYARFPEPILLYAQAQCFRLLGDIPQATAYFQAYMKLDASLPFRAEVEAALTEFGAEIPKIAAAVGGAVVGGVSAGVELGAEVAAPVVDAAAKIRPYRVPGIALGALAAVGVGVVGIHGIVVGLDPELEFNAKIGLGFGIGGLAVGGVAALLLSVQVSASASAAIAEHSPQVAPVLLPGGAGVSARLSF